MSNPNLFAPAQLGQLAVKNRIVMAPLTRSRASPLGVPATFAATYYAQRATAGLIVAEMTQISFEGMGYARTPGIHTPEQVAAWSRITDAVHKAGGRIVLQLGHVGRIASTLNRGISADVVAPSAIPAPGQMWTDQSQMMPHDVPRVLTKADIARIVADYGNAAANAVQAGFDGVEFHSANGYLPHQFLSTNANQRTDRYGGSVENRMRMPLEALSAITAQIGAGRVGIRVSPGHTFNGIEEADAVALYTHYFTALDAFGLAYLHVMRPFMNTIDFDPVGLARGLFKGPIIAAGGFDGVAAVNLVAAEGADAVAFGKAYISNPDLVYRLQTGAALAVPDETTFYTPGERGYSDYRPMSA